MSAQTTIRDTFRDAIANGSWEDIARVYEAITGEKAPQIVHVAVKDSMADLLSRPMGEVFQTGPQGERMEMVLPGPTPETEVHIHGSLLVPTEDDASIPKQTDDGHDDFSIQHGKPQSGGADEDGKTFASREPIPNYPDGRPNQFHDNGKAFKDEKVTENPDDPTLGVQVIGERGGRKATMINVQCRLCNKQESVSPALAQGHHTDPMHNTYTCNACCSGGSKNRRG